MPLKDRTLLFKSVAKKVEPEVCLLLTKSDLCFQVIISVGNKRKAPSTPGKTNVIHRLASDVGREIEEADEKLKELTKRLYSS